MVKKMIRIFEITNKFIDIIFPKKCMVCKNIIPFNEKQTGLCDECIKIFKQPMGHRCKQCNREICTEDSLGNKKEYCDICIKILSKKVYEDSKFYFTKNYSIFIYNDATKISIFDFKYNKNLSTLYGFETLLNKGIEKIQLPSIDIIIPAPLHRKKQKKRGFNQATLFSKIVSNIIGVKYNDKILVRSKNTSVQSNKPIKERYENLDNCFKVLKPDYIKNKTILLVDDIYTSGSTINTCSKELVKNGAKEVFSLTMSITPEKNDEIN